MNKKAILIAALLMAGAAIIFSGCKKVPLEKPAVEGAKAPGFSLPDTDGNTWTLSDLNGSVVVVNFWASWCDSCKMEMPSMHNMYKELFAEPGFHLLTILYRDDAKEGLKYLKDNGYSFTVLVDERERTARRYGVTGVPETYIIDKKGVLRDKIIGPTEFDTPDAIAYFRKLLSE